MPVGSLTAGELLIAGLAGAAVVACGGLYAFFLAWSFMHGRARDRYLAYSNYLALCLAFIALAQALRMGVVWHLAIAFLLIAYLVAPHLVWKLTRATHGETEKGGSSHD